MNSHDVYHLNETSYSSQYFCHCTIFLSVFYRIKFRIFLIFFTLANVVWSKRVEQYCDHIIYTDSSTRSIHTVPMN